jgi:HAE1 family hydrophobic/amphiphilic exporter-1
MMSLPGLSVRRPVAMCCLIIGLTLLGVNAYRKMGLEFLPKVDVPYATVVTIYPGGSPQEIETDIAKRIEDAVVSIDGLKHVTSSCMENVCQTLLEFNLEVDVDLAANDVREKLDLIINDFPEGTEKPKVLKFDVNAQPIITMALSGDVPVDELYDYADNALRDRLTVIPGVATVDLTGGAEREVQVLLDRDRLAARGLTSMSVVEALQRGVRLIPSGRIRQGDSEYSVKFDADYPEIAEIGSLPLASKDGSRCYVRDVAEVKMSTAELRQTAYLDGQPCISIKVVKKADANAVRVADAVRQAMGTLQSTLPGGMKLAWVTDDGTFIRATVDSTTGDIIQGVFLTALILFFFLYNFRSTIIVAITMPLTILIGLFLISAFGYTLNICTMLAIGLSVGILVTNSIVVLESITKRFEATGNAKEAAELGASEVLVAVTASAATNLVVLFPIAVMGSQIGLFMAPFAWSMILVTLVSLFISFTLTPILCSILLKERVHWRWSPLFWMERGFNRGFDGFARGFAGLLRIFERKRWAAVLFLLGTAVFFYGSLRLAAVVGFTFFDEPDRGDVFVKLEYPTRYNLEQTLTQVKEVEERLRALPYLQHMLTTIGKVQGMIGRSSEGVYLAQVLLKFNDKMDRPGTSVDDLIEQAREALKGHMDCIATIGKPSGVGGQGVPIELEVKGDDLDELDHLALNIQDLTRDIWGFKDPDTTVRPGKLEVRVRPDRVLLADLGVPATGVGLIMRANIEGLKSGVFKEAGRNYDIVVKMSEQQGIEQVESFLLPGMEGRPMTLSNVTSIEQDTAPVQITRKDKRRISKLYSGLDPKKPLGTAVDELSALIDQKIQLPPGYSYRYTGEYEIMSEATAEFLEASLISIMLVYLVLAALLESFKQPFIIMLTLPLGLVGILWALALARLSISMFVMLGAVMLIGIVVNNAILIMDRLNQLVAQGVPRHRAMIEASTAEFRPIVMITLAAILGMVPIATGTGLGSEMRASLGVAAIGGIALSALLTLLVIPIVYDLFTRKDKAQQTPETVFQDQVHPE